MQITMGNGLPPGNEPCRVFCPLTAVREGKGKGTGG